MMTVLDAALDWCRRSYSPIPVPTREKKPDILRWPALRITEANAVAYFNGAPQNIGVLLGDNYGAADVDLDCGEAIIAGRILLPNTGLVFGRKSKPRSHYFYRSDPPVVSLKFKDPIQPNKDEATICELRCLKKDGGSGLQTVVPPSIHPTGESITFEPGFDGPAANVDAEVITSAISRVAAAALLARHWPGAGSGRNEAFLALAGILARAKWSIEDTTDFSFAIYRVLWGDDAQRDACASEVRATYGKQASGDETTGTPKLISLIDKRVVKMVLGWLQIDIKHLVSQAAAVADLPQFSEENLAQRFSEKHADDLRHVDRWGKWMHFWDEHLWRADDTLAVFDAARAICRAAAAEVDSEHQSTAVRLASAKTVAAVEHLARCDRRHAATFDQWDSDKWMLNTPAGVVELNNGGILRPARRADYATKTTAVGPGGDCPLWLQFLDRVTGSDKSLQAFLRRVAGYALTGEIREHALFFLYGLGGNGKGVFMGTLCGILDGYAKTGPIEALIASKLERHPTDLAGLQGARLATVNETEEGRQWAEAKIKMLTGGDRIPARFMRQDFFEFVPQFKLLISGNHKPSLRTVDEAMKRRFHLVPFTVTIPSEERDLKLSDKLRGEWPGILKWAIDGCLEWQRDGLRPPAVVRAATDAYLTAEDSLSAWIDDCCLNSRGCWTSSAALFASWSVWGEKNREHIGTQKRFGQKLEERGYKSERYGKARGFIGLSLREDA